MRRGRRLVSAPRVTSREPDHLKLTATDLDINLDEIVTLGEEHFHQACCERDEFFCGRPFHPELVMGPDQDSRCAQCEIVFETYTCASGTQWVHLHCPFTGIPCR